ncbi:tonsoku-like protein [Ornithodoros turicata]|uniref:tonsoku-like protein n=1 Tax=Ornithodoros turicata TaxID=34597 RepID=UPI0031392E05
MSMSLKSIDEQIATAKRYNDTKAVCGLYISKGDALMDTCPEQAIEEYSEALQLLRGLDSDDEMLAHRRLGECYITLANFEQSRRHLKNYLDLATEKDNLVEQQRAWTTIGRSHHAQHLHDSSSNSGKLALDAYMKSLQLAQDLRDVLSDGREYSEMKGRAMYNIALLKSNDEAIPILESALYLFKKHNLNEDLCRCLSHLIDTHLDRGEGNAALQLCDKYLEVARNIKREDYKCRAYLMKGIAQLHVGDWEEARESLKRAYRKKPKVEEKARVMRYLKLSTVLREYSVELEYAKTSSEKCRLHEKVADVLIKFNLYSGAVKHYRLAVDTGIIANVDSKKLADLHASIATTYKDLKSYKLALEHFERELSYRTEEPQEAADTKMLMAQVVMAMSPKETARIRSILSEALQLYRSVGNADSEEKCLRALKSLEEESRIPANESDDEGTSTQSTEFSDIDEEEISECSDSDPEIDALVPKRRCKSIDTKVNYKGETPLHLAAIEGNLKRVRQLLKLNHSVNVRDNCGWTPLHEAANHGHLEVCKCLVEVGRANVNDPGGEACDGVTPLHDAIYTENLDVALYLLENGACVNARTTADKKTPLDLLQRVKKKHGENLSAEDKNLIRDVERVLLEKTSQVGSSLSATSSIRSEEEPDADISEFVSSEPDSNDARDVSRSERIKVPEAFVEEGEEDWCIDDLPKPKSKPKHLRQTKLNISRKRSNSSNCTSRSKVRKTAARNYEMEQETFQVDSDDAPAEEVDVAMQEVPHPPKAMQIRPSLRVRICDKLLLVPAPAEKSVGWLAEEASERYYQLVGIRPKLNITLSDGAVVSASDALQCLLDCGSLNIIGEVVSWNMPPLVERYTSACEKAGTSALENLIPVLEECESRGAFNLHFAYIPHVEQIFSVLRHQQNLHTLDIRGTRLNAASVATLASCLTTLQSLYSLGLRCTGLTSELLRVVADSSSEKIGALKLDLSFNYIGHDGGTTLGMFLARFPKLKTLELSDCSISDFGTSLRSLSTLEKLDVSNNPLSEGTAVVLSLVIKNSALKSLNIANCFSCLRTTPLSTLFADSSCGVREINLSCCNLEADDVRALTTYLPRGSLMKLDVTGNPSLSRSSLDVLCAELAGVKIIADAVR